MKGVAHLPTTTRRFGSSKREGHDAGAFYGRDLYAGGLPLLSFPGLVTPHPPRHVPPSPTEGWADRIYVKTAEAMEEIPDASVGLAFTSPPYNAGKDFDDDLPLVDYLGLIGRVAAEVHRVLVPGGRYVVNVAGLGRNPYVPLAAYYHAVHAAQGFTSLGEIIWRKGRGMNGNCAWGSWRSARSPRLRDLHEYLIVFCKDGPTRPDRGDTDITGEEFMAATLSVWDIPPESARRVGHPSPFPLPLASRVVNLLSYRGDVVLDPFAGSGTTLLAAKKLGRHFVGYEIEESYADLAKARLVGS